MTRISDMDIDLLLTLDALLQDRNITMRPRGWASASPRCPLVSRVCARCLANRCLSLPAWTRVLPTPRAEALRPQVTGVLRGISAMFAPTAFDAQTSSRTFVIALHENPALMLGTALLNRGYRCSRYSPALRPARDG